MLVRKWSAARILCRSCTPIRTHTVAILAVLLVACGDDRSTSCAQLAARAEQAPPGIAIQLSLSPSPVARGESIKLELRVENKSDRSVTYQHGGQEYELWIEGAGGIIWVWSQEVLGSGSDFQQLLQTETLQPSQSKRAVKTWHRTGCSGDAVALKPGRYSARGLWIATARNGGWLSDPVEFIVQ